MHRGNQDSRAGVKQRALAATGLVATAAAGGMGVTAVTAAEAQAASGVVHACYNKSTHALKYAKGSKCPKGSKLVTFNKQGPQGAAGAPGAQGPAGLAVGWATQRFNVTTSFSASVPTVVTSLEPLSTGFFAVDGTAVIQPYQVHGYECWDQGGTSNPSDVTPSGIFDTTVANHDVTIPTAGIIRAATVPIYEICKGGTGRYRGGEVVGIRLHAAYLTDIGLGAARASHKFSKSK